jgi:multisubunit Na+/H+ antiporter MnhE subunit
MTNRLILLRLAIGTFFVTLLVYFFPPSLTQHRNMKTLWVIIVYYVPMTSALYST